MNRRRLLLSYLANSFSWELYSKVYFYNELVPTTINGKNVLNKAKIVKVSGNGVIENQLVQNGNFEDTSNWSATNGTLSASNNILSYEITTIGGDYGSNRIVQLYTNLANHYYLIDIWVKTPYATVVRCYIDNFIDLGTTIANQWTRLTKIYKPTSSSGTNNIYFDVHGQASYQVGDVIQVRQYQKKDLTLREGTGNEPTSLTDNRIQNILNRGYIPFNLGKYKESDIGVVSSEPYNLFDGELELGYIADGVNYNSTTDIRSINYVKVNGGKNYTFGADNFSSYARLRVYEFNANKQYLKTQTIYGNTPQAFSVSNETRYIRFALYNNGATMSVPTDAKMYVHLTGTRTGYAPHKSFAPITFKAQLGGAINSHNTMEITNSAYVFTRNQWKYTFSGSENFASSFGYFNTNTTGYYGAYFSLNTAKLSANKIGIYPFEFTGSPSTNKNLFWNNPSTQNIGISLNVSLLGLTTGNLTDSECLQALKTYLSNNKVSFAYELATPQVISIPKKHLGIVDLGSLNYSEYGSTSDYTQYFTNGIDALAKNNGNAYCSLFMLQNTPRVAGTMFIGMGNGKLYFRTRVGEYASATDFKNAMSGTLLFFETENEVADIENVIDIESGGTITTDSEVLPNIELSVKCK